MLLSNPQMTIQIKHVFFCWAGACGGNGCSHEDPPGERLLLPPEPRGPEAGVTRALHVPLQAEDRQNVQDYKTWRHW